MLVLGNLIIIGLILKISVNYQLLKNPPAKLNSVGRFLDLRRIYLS
ncbi:hypothetical protein HU830_01780 [Lactobacillus sp. DCY120]|uniref:Uncharacterized protein n=1 Tax=Bombilactobacillus apium TaxID=2675299 RepID=A0A850QZ01_9LACO|nr:hypothetical protein [Bombilactobacillus apium]NVY95923.1 hypothetical protein [Bombilactobacillus apium]